ncbi:NAD(P)/FAD-dependent oxidoreductase [Caballeronia insecticola]|uniref:3-phenylpropionate dioxygenase ferredoxin-NAD(+) reductase component n=1 Tax=Caballeronia insecticola TaxID=758793 RepID=R4X3L7_9BURK|nr:FAD-dependent oxidoreductase [Caballeronia insecticola]BAN27521.1 3-phenylpropionate dioxygenase ferredoxin-NAD(+) reductase component [Caballeronia insecticola]
MTQTVLIIGAGQAGARAAEALRNAAFDGRIVLVGDERHAPYERPPLSKDVLTAHDDADCFKGWVHAADLYREARIEWLNDRLLQLDTQRHVAMLERTGELRYDHCLFTTGGRVRRLPSVPDGPHTFHLRTLDDAMRLRARLATARSVAVIGGGFLGLEFAASARTRGLDVSVFETASSLLSRALPPLLADRLRVKHEHHGVRFVFGAHELQVKEHATGVQVGAEHFDLCVIAIGQHPNDDIAKAAGIVTSNGIVVDRHCRTSAADVYAAGDCANFPYGANDQATRLESWQNAQEQAIVAARNIAGEAVRYAPTPWFWTDQYDWNIQMLGMPGVPVDGWIERAGADGKTVLMGLRDSVIVQAFAINQGGELRAIRRLVEEATPVDAGLLADPNVKLRQLERLTRSTQSGDQGVLV